MHFPVTLFAPNMTDEQFREWCNQYSDYRLECTADREPTARPVPGMQQLQGRLGNWVDPVKKGVVTDSSAGFVLPSSARRSPDAACRSSERIDEYITFRSSSSN